MWDEHLVVAACLEPIFKLEWIRATVEGDSSVKVGQAREWLRRAASDLQEDAEEGEDEDPDDVRPPPEKRRREDVPTKVRQLFRYASVYCFLNVQIFVFETQALNFETLCFCFTVLCPKPRRDKKRQRSRKWKITLTNRAMICPRF